MSLPALRARRVARAALGVVLLSGCQPKIQTPQLAGRGKSSRLTTTVLHLHPNGEWEIRDADEHVLQYGVWQLQDRTLVWTIKQEGTLQHDPNPIVAFEKDRFDLRERDGSITRFERLP